MAFECHSGSVFADSEHNFLQQMRNVSVHGVHILDRVSSFRNQGDLSDWSTRGRNVRLDEMRGQCEPGSGFYVRAEIDHYLVGSVLKEKGTGFCDEVFNRGQAVACNLPHAPGATAYLFDLEKNEVLDFGPLRWLRGKAFDLVSGAVMDPKRAYAVIALDGSVVEIFRWDFRRIKKTVKSTVWGSLVVPMYRFVYHCLLEV